MKTLVKVFFRLLFVSAGLFIFSESKTFAQNQPNLLDLRTCGKSCSSNNFTIKEVYLSNASGVPLANSFATCTPGVQQTAFISFVYSSNSGSSTDNTRLFADLVIGGSSQYINVWLGNLPAAKSGDRVVTLNYQFTWTCGLEVSLRNPLMAWTTSGSANLSNSYQCNDYPKCSVPVWLRYHRKCPVGGSVCLHCLHRKWQLDRQLYVYQQRRKETLHFPLEFWYKRKPHHIQRCEPECHLFIQRYCNTCVDRCKWRFKYFHQKYCFTFGNHLFLNR
jgi:hypothetical protein